MTRHPQNTQLLGRTPLPQPKVLPTTREEMNSLGWDELDILLVSGDGYVDHPSFGVALLGRWLVAHGFRTGIIAQPRWDSAEDITRMGRPTLYAGVSAGAIDSMLAHYTAFRKKRHDDAYTPGGKAGARPNRATIVYTSLVKQAFAGIPVILGGIEASLRRISHYDFWTDKLRRSILADSKADVIVYGMGERAMLEIAHRLSEQLGFNGEKSAIPARESLLGIYGTAIMGKAEEIPLCETPEGAPALGETVLLPSHEEILKNPAALMQTTLQLEKQVHASNAWAVQPMGARAVLLSPPAIPLAEEEMDALYALPFSRKAHPSYKQAIPADDMIRSSITTHRGCGGGCSFCSLALHQGRRITSRSRRSIMQEAKTLSGMHNFNGSISDVGGPSANMWQAHCSADASKCRRSSCMHPKVCPSFRVRQKDTIELLRKLRNEDGIKHVRVASGVRFDLAQQEEIALRAYTMEFTGGQLKVAPEHICDPVLDLMRKPGLPVFERFLDAFLRYSRAAEKEQYVIPYLMSGFPGCKDEDMHKLGSWLAKRGWKPQQVQCFIPTPGTVATAMFHAEIDPDGNPLYVAKTDAERLRQHGILMPDMGNKTQNKNNRAPAKGKRNNSQPASKNQAGKKRSSQSSSYKQGSENEGWKSAFPTEKTNNKKKRSHGKDSAQGKKPKRTGASSSKRSGKSHRNR